MKIKKYSKEKIKKALAYALCGVLAIFFVIGSFTLGASATDDVAPLVNNECPVCHEGFIVGDTCRTCGFKCSHQFDGCTCVICGYEKDHNFKVIRYSYSVIGEYHDAHLQCTDCGYTDFEYNLPHEFNGGICSLCEMECPHDTTQSCVCTVCGSPSHDFDNGVCTSCGQTCRHFFPNESNVCADCGFVCGHYNSTNYYTFVVTSGANRTHSVRAWCSICHQRNYDDPRNGARENCVFNSEGVCTICPRVCTHPEGTYNDYVIIDGNTKYHTLNKVCGICHVITQSVNQAHENDGEAPLSYEHTGDPKTHGEIYNCSLCGFHERATVNHTFNVKYHCNCGYTCTHYFNDKYDANCIYCSYVCKHENFIKQGRVYKCSRCVYTLSNPKPYEYTNYFDSAPFNQGFNCNKEFLFESSEDPDFPRFYEHYTIADSSDRYDRSVGIHLIGGESIDQSASLGQPVPAGRFFVVRLRKSGVEHLRIALYGGDEPKVFSDINNELTYIHFYPIEDHPDNEWYDLVITLDSFDQFSGDDSTYPLDAVHPVETSITHALFTLCFTFADDSGYVDVQYVAMCSTWAQLDQLANCIDVDPFRHYVRAVVDERNGYASYNLHSYGKDSTCDYCGYTCTHSVGFDINEYNDKKICGYEKICKRCKVITENTVGAHTFDNGLDKSVCTRCGRTCKHVYSIGKCIYCDFACTHVFPPNRASCKYCFYIPETPTENDDTLAFDLITSIYDAQANTFLSLLNYNIFGVNIAMIIGALVTLAVTIFIIKKVK